MSSLNNRYQPNVENVAAKVLEGEVVLIHVTKGAYHNLDNVGCRIWQLIECRFTLDDIAKTIAIQYNVDAESVRNDVLKFVDALLNEDLIVEATGPATASAPDLDVNSLSYEVPNLNTFDDMADLLALDPPMPGLQSGDVQSNTDEK